MAQQQDGYRMVINIPPLLLSLFDGVDPISFSHCHEQALTLPAATA